MISPADLAKEEPIIRFQPTTRSSQKDPPIMGIGESDGNCKLAQWDCRDQQKASTVSFLFLFLLFLTLESNRSLKQQSSREVPSRKRAEMRLNRMTLLNPLRREE